VRGSQRTRALVAAVCTMVASCAIAPESTRPEVALPDRFDATPAAAAAAPALGRDWWKLFADPVLDALVADALKDNVDLALAAARVDEAAAVLGVARAAQWPQVYLTADVTRAHLGSVANAPNGRFEGTTHRVAAGTSFEVDLFGRLRNASAAARSQLLAAQQAKDTVQLALAANVAQTYFALRAFDSQLALVESQLQTRADSAALVGRRAAGGVASGLDVEQSRAALATTAAQRPELLRQRTLLEQQLGQLTGRPGRKVERAAAGTALPQPAAVPPGLPSDLLQRRPDVQQAENTLRSAQAQVAIAKAALWPTITLTGSFGAQSADLADLLKGGARVWSIGPALLLPIFDGGRNVARTDQAKAQAEQAALAYRKAAQTAYGEVADALVAGEQARAQEAELERLREAAEAALRIANRRYDAGYSPYLEVLDAQRNAQDAALALVRARQARLDASVGVIRALGGGWTATAR
jgi:multidrug efflux system outer membrane protein